ncbi:hypothetical protein E3N88_38972 [Mikania micrantha]|uniref:Importin N-terminal domain-containing protein n=1 Tax=Mikania micrantha TaxID=192012 RepID=A0A5N6LWB4_9ASTR|nr:hypothetical protein E3N88_38972 [Mikania micrantha]
MCAHGGWSLEPGAMEGLMEMERQRPEQAGRGRVVAILRAVLEGVIKYRWNVLPAEQRDGLKNYISDVIVKLLSEEVFDFSTEDQAISE